MCGGACAARAWMHACMRPCVFACLVAPHPSTACHWAISVRACMCSRPSVPAASHPASGPRPHAELSPHSHMQGRRRRWGRVRQGAAQGAAHAHQHPAAQRVGPVQVGRAWACMRACMRANTRPPTLSTHGWLHWHTPPAAGRKLAPAPTPARAPPPPRAQLRRPALPGRQVRDREGCLHAKGGARLLSAALPHRPGPR